MVFAVEWHGRSDVSFFSAGNNDTVDAKRHICLLDVGMAYYTAPCGYGLISKHSPGCLASIIPSGFIVS